MSSPLRIRWLNMPERTDIRAEKGSVVEVHPHQSQELLAGGVVVLEAAAELAGDGVAVDVLHAPGLDAEMARMDHHGDIGGFENMLEGVVDLLGQALLNLGAAREIFHHA